MSYESYVEILLGLYSCMTCFRGISTYLFVLLVSIQFVKDDRCVSARDYGCAQKHKCFFKKDDQVQVPDGSKDEQYILTAPSHLAHDASSGWVHGETRPYESFAETSRKRYLPSLVTSACAAELGLVMHKLVQGRCILPEALSKASLPLQIRLCLSETYFRLSKRSVPLGFPMTAVGRCFHQRAL
ncbi:hypothetical protein BU24DRAFT_49397 [Aaosphaeria arxii CBS 175.79]|uniref:Uncharacterized protein n=1 Tax=Aaosphaeria arxii CBS 175.79 TaxID=1450172 RepID=A0A6A5XDR2_9PLEO|nr:uncharacterized protein BU24DRAFT_49397 [Aaosphaeria arxii CBS 175.79]KAF2010947.1 hypothetical protein BU24DRAFT_49397 [Aaosphaeria arxii CBS 175.79]